MICLLMWLLAGRSGTALLVVFDLGAEKWMQYCLVRTRNVSVEAQMLGTGIRCIRCLEGNDDKVSGYDNGASETTGCRDACKLQHSGMNANEARIVTRVSQARSKAIYSSVYSHIISGQLF